MQKRKYLLDGVSKRKKDVVGHVLTVLFRPEDLDLIAGSPHIRRSFLNIVLSQTHTEYRYSLDAYEKALKRRNALLDVLRDGKTTRASFTFWDQLLIKHGNILTNMRRDFIDFLNTTQDFAMKFSVTYDPSTISEKRLHQYAVEEVAAGYTLVGPHKDDISIALTNGDEKNLATYGSRGEQRMGVLWLKYYEMMYIEHARGERPILLLDDIFSELDEKHKEMVTELTQHQQTIFTTTEQELPRHTKHESIFL
ncbi:MAG: DNA replication/repair protein RecF [Candidatus Pacebacteria bacterium]|nr:DNA replication/repair protein RecF [Candidatus Paceibacterota bacterium]